MSIPPSKLERPSDAEYDEVIAYAKTVLRDYAEEFAETGVLPSHIQMGGGSHGDLRQAKSAGHTRSVVGIYMPSSREVETATAWHDYCAKHGYPAGELTGADEKPDSKYPPRPTFGAGRWIGLSWTAIRADLRGESKRQLDLFGGG